MNKIELLYDGRTSISAENKIKAMHKNNPRVKIINALEDIN